MKKPEGAMEEADGDIAVIGIGCNFPGGEGLDNFWRVLLEGRNCTVEIPAERFDTAAWYHPDENAPGKTQTTRAALIDGFNEFDHKFFGISEAEAELMDPQQKLLLQCTHRALEDAGIPAERLNGSPTGVYIGLMNRDYEMLRSNNPATITHYNGTGTAMSIAANRISFTFDLSGPSVAIDSACSSSLVALHLACQAIKQGDCEMALCGGVNCIIEPRVFVALSRAKMISPEGTSKPFSSRADGYGRGEGCGVLLLKPLENALQDGNKIWGVICRTAVNQDGRSVSPITKPSRLQQEELLKRIYSESDLANVQYVEAHGTGTPAGDPTEAASISNVIAKARRPGSPRLRVGSVKGNIGHTESAAGVAGLIKVLLMMKHQTIVPSVFYSEDSSSVDVNMLGLSIPTRAERWSRDGSLMRVAGINSFGFGGTNAHVIVKECRRARAPTQFPAGAPKVFVLSAASEKSLLLSMMDTKQRLERHCTVDLQALSYTSACGRSHSKHKYRKAVLVSSLSDLQDQLTPKTKLEPTKSGVQVVFVFSGNGTAFRGMCQQLFREVPAFRNKVREVESLFQRHASISITQWLDGDGDGHDGDFSRPDVAQPLLFAIQVGIAALLKLWGIRPAAVVGHSAGEVAAAHCSGLLSLQDAVKVVYYRSALQSTVTGGRMLVVGNVAVEEVLKVLHIFSENICVAAFNSPQSCTLSGDSDAIDALHHKLKTAFVDRKIYLHTLDVPAAYHSHMMEPILDDIRRNLHCFVVNDMECKLYSTVTGNKCEDGDFSTGGYWAKNIKEPVLFEQTLYTLTKDNQSRRNMVFVEIGPRRALQRNIHETLGGEVIVLSSVQPEKESVTLFSTMAKLFELGIDVQWAKLYQGCRTPPTPIPVYHFDNTKKDMCFEAVRTGAQPSTSPHVLISQTKQDSKDYLCSVSRESASYLWEHKHHGVSIMPGAFYTELAYATLMAYLKPKTPVSLLKLSITFQSVLTLTLNCQQLKVTLADTEEAFAVHSPVASHASGTFRCSKRQPVLEETSVCLDAIFQRCKFVMKRGEVYSILSLAGFKYGSVFKQLEDVHFGQDMREAVAAVQVPSEIMQDIHEYYIHPVILDYFLQMTGVVAMGCPGARQGLPSAIGSIVIAGPLQEDMVMYLRATQETPDFLEVCGCFSTPEGRLLVELLGVRVTFLGSSSNITQSAFFHNEIIPLSAQKNLKRRIKALVFEDKLGIAEALQPFLHPESTTVARREDWRPGQLGDVVRGSLRDGVREILFLWAVEDVSHLPTEQMLDSMVRCCELFRQVVVASKGHSCTVRVITYRSTAMVADRISPAFVLSGMTRACAAEVPGLSFQLVDLTSVTQEDITMLVHVINTSKQQEVLVSKGKASVTKIARTPVLGRAESDVRDFDLHTADPHRMEALSGTQSDSNQNNVSEKSVEVQLTNMCVHSCDYFPVSAAHFNLGSTLYWSNHTSHCNQLLALDFSGIVTTVGKDVRDVRVGDHVASCYPVAASAKVVIPESVCYDTKRLPYLKESPCVSYFVLAWEILQRTLPTVRKKQLVVITPNLASALIKVLALTANRSGWNVSCLPHLKVEPPTFDLCQVFVFFPPFDLSWQEIPNKDVQERHVILVGSSSSSSSLRADVSASRSELMHVYKLDVAQVLQRAKLRAQSRTFCKWLVSLGFDALPLKTATLQTPAAAQRRAEAAVESYFTTNTVRQLVARDSARPFDVLSLTPSERLFHKEAVYIVTGGLTGLGLETVKFIARNGGGCIVTLSRRTPTDKVQLGMDLLQKRCRVEILNLQCDVSVWQQVVEAISHTQQRFSPRPIKGVFHSAAVLHDALIETLDETLIRKVLQPKISGALNIHNATLSKDLDFFVCYSSISAFIGNTSQSNYAAANSFLDSFCHYRRALGLAGQSINWGPLNLGLLLNKDHFQKFLQAKGMMILDVCEVHQALRECLLGNSPQQVVCKFNFKNLNRHVLSQNASLRERLSALVETELRQDPCDESRRPCLSSAHESLKMMVSDVSNISVMELDDSSALWALGIDSMLAMSLQNKIFQEAGVNIPLVRLLDPNTTLASLTTYLKNNGHDSCDTSNTDE